MGTLGNGQRGPKGDPGWGSTPLPLPKGGNVEGKEWFNPCRARLQQPLVPWGRL